MARRSARAAASWRTTSFPADGMYTFRLNVAAGVGTRLEDLDVSINGERVALLHYEKGIERTLASADAPGWSGLCPHRAVFVRAGQQRVAASFVRHGDGPYEDLIKPHDWSQASNGTASAGTTEPPHLLELSVIGPTKITGDFRLAEPPIDLLLPSQAPAAARTCARQIMTRTRHQSVPSAAGCARRSGTHVVLRHGRKKAGFEEGVRMAHSGDARQSTLRFPLRNRTRRRTTGPGLPDQRFRSCVPPLVLPVGIPA